MVGLGRMGSNMVRRLMRAGHALSVTDLSAEAVATMAKEGATGAASLKDLVASLAPPRAVWVMVPAGGPTEQTVMTLGDLLSAGDAIVDGGNSWFKDDVRRARALAPKGVHYVDAGTSGGVWGAERGYCLMVGGPAEAVSRLEPLFASLAPGESGIPPSAGREGKASPAARGYLHCGPSGAGHFVKMIHNGIEYGLMQAYAEGFDILRHAGDETLPADQRYNFDLADIAELWRRGSVIPSWILDLTAQALASDPNLDKFGGKVADSGEGRWAVAAATDEGVPAHVLSSALYERFSSRGEADFADKLLSAMRYEFGGHLEKPVGP